MGCGSGNKNHYIVGEKLISQIPINTIIYNLGEFVEEEVSKIKYFVNSVEELRHAIIDELDYISLFTGACSFNTYALNLKYCIIALSWKLATDNKGRFQDSGMEYFPKGEQKIKFSGRNCSKEGSDASNYLFSYLGRIEKLKERLLELNETQNDIIEILEYWKSGKIDEKEEGKEKIDKLKLKCNTESSKNSIKILKELHDVVLETINQGNEGIKFLLNEENHAELNKIGLKNFKAQIKIPYIIVWRNLKPTERFETEKSGYLYVNELIVKKKKIKTEYKNKILK